MKKFAIIVTATLFLFACNSDEKTASAKVMYSDLSGEGLKGQVASIEESRKHERSTGRSFDSKIEPTIARR